MSDIKQILKKAEEGNGLLYEETGFLLKQANNKEWDEAFLIAKKLTQENFKKRINFFVPIYFSNYCVNNCKYCGFRKSNELMKRRALSESEFLEEAKFLWHEGNRNLLLISSEHPYHGGLERIAAYLEILKRNELDFSIIVEIAPLDSLGYKLLKEMGVSQCLLFQETYDQNIYSEMHEGPKKDFKWRYGAMERALQSGIDRVGLGVLFGLGPFEKDLAQMIEHAWSLKKNTGKFPVSLSFPRIRPTFGNASYKGNHISDEDFKKILAVSRLALPSVGISLTTRETPAFRDELLDMEIGITHLSAGSSTKPGGYTLEKEDSSQFEIMDLRSLGEMVISLKRKGYIPIFDNRDKAVLC